MRIAVANRYWSTAGGGEAYALAIARALEPLGAVELLAPPGVDWASVSSRLQCNVTRLARRTVDFGDVSALGAASADYDLFVNTTYGSNLASHARKSLLVVLFPYEVAGDLSAAQSRLIALAHRSRLVDRAVTASWLGGTHGVEGTGATFEWTDGDGVLAIDGLRHRTIEVAVQFGGDVPQPTSALRG